MRRLRYFRITVQYELVTSQILKYVSFISQEYRYPLDEDIIDFVKNKVSGSEKHYVVMVAEMSKKDFERYKESKDNKPKIITK